MQGARGGAELCFMAGRKGLGMVVLKPFGESGRYDVAVENGGPIHRVADKVDDLLPARG